MGEREKGERWLEEGHYCFQVREDAQIGMGRTRCVAEFPYYYRSHRDARADAHLFLAAPALYAFAACCTAYNEFREGRISRNDLAEVLHHYGWSGDPFDIAAPRETSILVSEFLVDLRVKAMRLVEGRAE